MARIDYHKLKEDGSKDLAFPPTRWVRWLYGVHKVAVTYKRDDAKYWTGLAVTKMEDMMHSQGFTAEMMETWDPERRSLRAEMWEDEKYAHLFKIPEKI